MGYASDAMGDAANFWVRQDEARRGTRRMVVLFLLGVIATILIVFFITGWFIGSFDPRILALVCIIVGGGIAIATLTKVFELSRQGGRTIALAMGGRLVAPAPVDPDERKLRNVVEEMAIASGVPVPEIYLLDQERSINAFAAGYTPEDAVIGVTRGAVQLLNREELQGVIAHEFSHILNGDMKLNIRLISLIFGLMFLTVIGRIMLYSRPTTTSGSSTDNDKIRGSTTMFFLGLMMIVVGWCSVLFGKIIQASISRRREHLADASAVQFTRNPLGLASALKKIGAHSAHSYIQSPEAEEAAHLFFANGLSTWLGNIFATHPPLVERIKLLDSDFDGDFKKSLATASVKKQPAVIKKEKEKDKERPDLRRGMGLAAAAILAGGYETTGQAQDLLETLPEEVRRLSADPLGGIVLVCGILLDENDAVAEVQYKRVVGTYGESVGRDVLTAAGDLRDMSRSQKLALVTLCVPALRGMSAAQFESFNKVIYDLIVADNRVDLFEYCVLKNVEHHLTRYFQPKPRREGKETASALVSEIVLVLSILARAEGAAENEARAAFAKGIAAVLGNEKAELLPLDKCTFKALDNALENINSRAAQAAKTALLEACQTVVASTNGQVTPDEEDLVRAVALAIK